MAELEPECDEDLPPFDPFPSPTPSQEEADAEQECDPIHRAEQDLADGQSTQRVAGDLLRFAKEQKRNIKDLKEKIPEDFICPITRELMTDPVMCADGHSYERDAITRWLTNSEKSPNTGLALTHKKLTPNITLKKTIEAWNPELYETAKQTVTEATAVEADSDDDFFSFLSHDSSEERESLNNF
eukprot:COSAG05_NODE_8531_length_695_cov_2.807047_1_plen_184_part_10